MQYLKKELSDEVKFLHTDKHESLLQIDSMILMVNNSQSSQNSKFVMSISKKKLKMKLIFYMQINIIKVSYKGNVIIINGRDQAFSDYSK